jgi:hypothetical protein
VSAHDDDHNPLPLLELEVQPLPLPLNLSNFCWDPVRLNWIAFGFSRCCLGHVKVKLTVCCCGVSPPCLYGDTNALPSD